MVFQVCLWEAAFILFSNNLLNQAKSICLHLNLPLISIVYIEV